MRALPVAADRLGNIRGILANHGITIVGHVTRRDPAHQRRAARPGASLAQSPTPNEGDGAAGR